MVGAFFLDTSALVKKYMTETGSTWIETLTDAESDNKIILARVTWVETLSAFTRLKRENRIDPNVLTQTINVFKADWESQFRIAEVEKSDYEKAGELYNHQNAADSANRSAADVGRYNGIKNIIYRL